MDLVLSNNNQLFANSKFTAKALVLVPCGPVQLVASDKVSKNSITLTLAGMQGMVKSLCFKVLLTILNSSSSAASFIQKKGLATDRLLYADRILSVGPSFLQHLIHLESDLLSNSWLTGLKADLVWMHEVNPQTIPRDWSQDLSPLFEAWQNPRYPWKAL